MILRFVAILDWLAGWLGHLASISFDNFSRPGTGFYFVTRSLTTDEILASFCSQRVGLLFFTLS